MNRRNVNVSCPHCFTTLSLTVEAIDNITHCNICHKEFFAKVDSNQDQRILNRGMLNNNLDNTDEAKGTKATKKNLNIINLFNRT